MEKWISPMEKRNFLKWFLQNHRLKRTEARKILEYIINHYPYLENLSFTEKAANNQKTILVSSMDSDDSGFVFYHHQHRTEDVSEALGNLMLNPAEKVYMVIHFSGKLFNQRYIQLVESPAEKNIRRLGLQEKDAKKADMLIDKIMADTEIGRVKKLIDQALDNKDKELFLQLTDMLNQMAHPL